MLPDNLRKILESVLVEDSPPKIDGIFAKGGRYYATDGIICLRTLATFDVPDDKDKAKAWLLFGWNPDQHAKDSTLIPNPLPVGEPCASCKGVGIVCLVDCDECNGTGGHECGCGDEHECRSCAGKGRIRSYDATPTKCDTCRGYGSVEKSGLPKRCPVGDWLYACWLLKMIGQWTDRLYLPKGKRPQTTWKKKPAYFVSNEHGIEGLVMPCELL